MHEHLWNHAGEEEPDQTDGEAEVGPVVPIFHDLEAVTVEVDVTVKIHLVEGLHGYLVLAMILGLVGGLLEGKIVLDGTAWIPSLLVLSRADGGHDQPEAGQQGDSGEEGKEESGLVPTADLP